MKAKYAAISQRIAVTAPNPTTYARVCQGRILLLQANAPTAPESSAQFTMVIHVIPPPDGVIEIHGIADGVDEERQGEQCVGGKGVGRLC